MISVGRFLLSAGERGRSHREDTTIPTQWREGGRLPRPGRIPTLWGRRKDIKGRIPTRWREGEIEGGYTKRRITTLLQKGIPREPSGDSQGCMYTSYQNILEKST